jgi:CHASE3 domain sensor protein
MPDPEIIDLLTQIRDLQRQHVENYQHAVEQQQKAIRLWKRTLVIVPIALFVFLFLFLIVYLLGSR